MIKYTILKAISVALVLFACGTGASQSSPERTAKAYMEALSKGDYERIEELSTDQWNQIRSEQTYEQQTVRECFGISTKELRYTRAYPDRAIYDIEVYLGVEFTFTERSHFNGSTSLTRN